MRFHDFHLNSYTVSKGGREILLQLIYDYPPRSIEESRIQFQDVEFYHFVHTSGSIILDIAEFPLAQFLAENWELMMESMKAHGGISHWRAGDDRASYQARLEAKSYKAWEISSSIGFHGIIVAKAIEDVPPKAL